MTDLFTPQPKVGQSNGQDYIAWSDEDRTEMAERISRKIRVVGECWEWIGSVRTDGYGQITFRWKNMKAHRASFAAKHGFMPPPHRQICHSCDNPICVNPSHLWEGSHEDNSKDMVSKGRSTKGRKNPGVSKALTGCKLSAETRAKMSAAQKGNMKCRGHKQSAELVARRTAVLIGLKRSDESNAKNSEAQKLVWAKRRAAHV